MRDVPEIDVDDLTPDFTWAARDGSHQTVRAWIRVTGDGVALCVATDTCGFGNAVETQPMPAETAFALARYLANAATDAAVQSGSLTP